MNPRLRPGVTRKDVAATYMRETREGGFSTEDAIIALLDHELEPAGVGGMHVVAGLFMREPETMYRLFSRFSLPPDDDLLDAYLTTIHELLEA